MIKASLKDNHLLKEVDHHQLQKDKHQRNIIAIVLINIPWREK
jgi:hypothetical protein